MSLQSWSWWGLQSSESSNGYGRSPLKIVTHMAAKLVGHLSFFTHELLHKASQSCLNVLTTQWLASSRADNLKESKEEAIISFMTQLYKANTWSVFYCSHRLPMIQYGRELHKTDKTINTRRWGSWGHPRDWLPPLSIQLFISETWKSSWTPLSDFSQYQVYSTSSIFWLYLLLLL